MARVPRSCRLTRGPTRPAPVNQNVEPTSVKTSQDCSTTLIKRMAIVGLVQQICSIALAASDPAIRLILGAEIRYSHQFWCPRAPSPLALTCFWKLQTRDGGYPAVATGRPVDRTRPRGQAARAPWSVRPRPSVCTTVRICQSSCCRGYAHARPPPGIMTHACACMYARVCSARAPARAASRC